MSVRITRSTLRFGANLTCDRLWASSGLTEDHADARSDGQKFSKDTTFNTVCATTSETVDRQRSFVLHDWDTIRGTRISRSCVIQQMQVRVFSDSTVCVLRFKNRDPYNVWATKIGGCIERTWVSLKHETGSPSSAVIWHVLPDVFYH